MNWLHIVTKLTSTTLSTLEVVTAMDWRITPKFGNAVSNFKVLVAGSKISASHGTALPNILVGPKACGKSSIINKLRMFLGDGMMRCEKVSLRNAAYKEFITILNICLNMPTKAEQLVGFNELRVSETYLSHGTFLLTSIVFKLLLFE